ncbi:sodium-dependent transporter [Nanoarchaeota archaeon]
MRERWGSRFIFILASIGSAAGLGNIWRFPYMAGKYGGGAFLVPYFIILFLLGIPLLILEFGLGQKMQRGAIAAFAKIKNKFSGLGFGALCVGFAVSTYYTVIMAWTLIYFVYAFTLEWGSDTSTFFYDNVLHVSSPGSITSIVPIVLIALVIVWIIIYFSVWKGLKSIGRLMEIIIPIPLLLLAILFIQGVLLPNSWAGLYYFLNPNFSVLLDIEVWMVAAGQIFFSLSIGFGIMIAYASFRSKKDDIVKNAFIISLSDSFIAVLGGLVVFSTLGFMAMQEGVLVSELAASGPALAFIVFPKALSLVPLAPVFAVIFFLTLFLLALSSEISMVEAIQTVITDRFPKWKKELVILCICLASFAVGIIYTTDGGIYILDIVDHFVVDYGLLIVGFSEAMIIGWIFGADKLRKYISKVSDWSLGSYFNYLIKIIVPFGILFMLVYQFGTDIIKPYENYPLWTILAFGWAILGLIILLSFIVSAFTKRKKW